MLATAVVSTKTGSIERRVLRGCLYATTTALICQVILNSMKQNLVCVVTALTLVMILVTLLIGWVKTFNPK